MTAGERGFLLLSSHLGNPERPTLTAAQLRVLAERMQSMPQPLEDRRLSEGDLRALGYNREMCRRILSLLEEEQLLEAYLRLARKQGCVPVTRVSAGYPPHLRRRLGLESPGCLWAKGDLSILKTPMVSLVGSRELKDENCRFAEAVGYEAAMQGLTLVSGNARGADRTAQEACLQAGGRVISVVADELGKKYPRENCLYLSEEDFSAPFSSARALSRNRCIHALGQVVFVAQSGLQTGGTWSGTVKNLRHGWSPVACFRDGSESSRQLCRMGAQLVGIEDIKNLLSPEDAEIRLF